MTLSGHTASDDRPLPCGGDRGQVDLGEVHRPADRFPRLGVRELSKVPISRKPIRSKMP